MKNERMDDYIINISEFTEKTVADFNRSFITLSATIAIIIIIIMNQMIDVREERDLNNEKTLCITMFK